MDKDDNSVFLDHLTKIAPTFLYIYELDTLEFTWMNRSRFSDLGYSEAEIAEMGENPQQALMHEEDKPVFQEHLEKVPTLEAGELTTVEYRIVHKDGDWCWFQSREMVYRRNADGRPVQIIGSSHDITQNKRRQERTILLMREVNHRAKNLLAVVQAIVRQTARESSPDLFADRLSDRLQGLSASQDLIIRGNWEHVDLEDLVRSQLNHLGQTVETRVHIEGEPIIMRPAAAQGIGMALHELATNAMKYGALSNDDGIVIIRWAREDKEGQKRFIMEWTERGGPPVEKPQHDGFGRTVIEQMAAQAASGEVELLYDQSGVTWKLDAPAREFRGILRQ